jgi:hypothetical protein
MAIERVRRQVVCAPFSYGNCNPVTAPLNAPVRWPAFSIVTR